MKFLFRKINYRCDLANALTPISGVTHSTKTDVAFNWKIDSIPASFKLNKRPLLAGWYMLEVIMTSNEQYLDCTLTIDYNDGSQRNHTFMVISDRITKRVLLLKKGFHNISLSPSEKALSLSVLKMTLVKLTKQAAYQFMHKKLLTYRPGNDYSRSLHLWRHYENLYRLQHKSETDYQDWINRRELSELRRSSHLVEQDKFCFIIDATNNIDIKAVTRSLDSIRAQIYTLWNIIVIIDHSLSESVQRDLKQIASQQKKVAFINTSCHTSTLFKNLLDTSDASHFITVEQGTNFSPYAVSVFARHLQNHQNSHITYSDNDTISNVGIRHSPCLKPDWNSNLMLSTNYIGNTIVVSRQLLNESENNRFTSIICWVYQALVTSAYRNSDLPTHVTHILHHLPEKNKTANASSPNNQLSILNSTFENTGISAKETRTEGVFRIQWPLPSVLPFISIIIPTKDNLPTLKRAIDSIVSNTDYRNYEIVVVNNQSKHPETLDYLEKINHHHNKRVLHYDKPFNYSAINNYAVDNTEASYVLLLNNDVEVINKEWLDELVRHANRNGIGCVGAKLYYPDGRIQHGGVIVGLSGCAGHSHKFYQSDDEGYMQRLLCTQNYSAVTAACLLVKKELYLAVGGLNEENLSVAFNDVDFCLKIQSVGCHNVWTPWSRLYHYESLSRGQDDTKQKRKRLTSEIQYMKRTWNTTTYEDPYYNKRLTRLREDFSLGF